MNNFSFSPVGYISSCYKEKFSIPRQPGLVSGAKAVLTLTADYSSTEIVRGMEGFSHLWLVFAFHAVPLGQWKPTVRPPRLGGNKRLGVFATRSTHRPNPIGLSVVELLNIENSNRQITLDLGSCDLLHGTPVLDIKPYISYVDSIPSATSGFAPEPPERKLRICFSEKAKALAAEASIRLDVNIIRFIEELLSLDPRPSYKSGQFGDRIYATMVYDFDLQWRYISEQALEVIDLSVKDDQ